MLKPSLKSVSLLTTDTGHLGSLPIFTHHVTFRQSWQRLPVQCAPPLCSFLEDTVEGSRQLLLQLL